MEMCNCKNLTFGRKKIILGNLKCSKCGKLLVLNHDIPEQDIEAIRKNVKAVGDDIRKTLTGES